MGRLLFGRRVWRGLGTNERRQLADEGGSDGRETARAERAPGFHGRGWLRAQARAGAGRELLREQRGSAPAEFVMVGGLLTLLALATVQLALVLHVRNTLTDAAVSAARYGSLGDRGVGDAKQRAVELVSMTLGESFASDISAGESTVSGTRVLEVRVRSPLPLVGLAGPAGLVTVAGHAPIV